ncbi:MAG TPA: helix-turn-helix domain-containing protein [Candidatus Rubrimentiphilum sp.]|nr:helix-turn-helix domain-containing protein [Candidatus Rubrimentiphilum sp.]
MKNAANGRAPDAMEALQRNVVYRRAENRISQADLADKARVARQTISKIESGEGNVTVQVLERIAAVLGCGVEELFKPRSGPADDAELERRANAPASEFIDARALLDAIDEANEVRYSRAGRPRALENTVSSRSRS